MTQHQKPKKTNVIAAAVTDEVNAEICRLCESSGMTKSMVVSFLLEVIIKKHHFDVLPVEWSIRPKENEG